jgi:hypothetical protein
MSKQDSKILASHEKELLVPVDQITDKAAEMRKVIEIVKIQ